MHQRVNVTLPEETIALIDRLAKKTGVNRSRLLDRAARHYVHTVGRTNLRKLLKEGAIVRSTSNLELAEEWFAADAETWPRAR